MQWPKNTDMRLSYIGHRHVTRILPDYYGKGNVRSDQESTSLRAYSRNNYATAPECIQTNRNAHVAAAKALFITEKYNQRIGRLSEHKQEITL